MSLAFFSGNEVFWKTRWDASTDGSNTPYRTLITYKETHFNAPTDPQDPPTWTGTWADPRFSPPADGGNPANSLTGQYFAVNAGTTDIQVPSQYAPELLWRNTAVANLAPGQSVTLGKGLGTLGYEWDVDSDNGFRPSGEIDLSSTTENANAPDQVFDDYGTNVVPATVTHHLTLYKTASGAYVFGAGTVQFSYGLASSNPAGAQPDPNMEQFTVNLFALMGAQPTTLTAGLVPGSASHRHHAPHLDDHLARSRRHAHRRRPGHHQRNRHRHRRRGGGRRRGLDRRRQHLAPGDGHPRRVHHLVLRLGGRARQPHRHHRVARHRRQRQHRDAVRRRGRSTSTVPAPSGARASPRPSPIRVSGSPVEVGVKFTSDVYGTINGIRFYKSTANTGTHVGNLWTAGGQLLASATFTSETASGWQSVSFSKPVPILPGTTYVASYFAPKGHTADDDYYLYDESAARHDGSDRHRQPAAARRAEHRDQRR